MSRISLVEPLTAPMDVQNIYEHRLRGRPANVHKAMAHLPQVLTPFLALFNAVGRTLPPRLYELIYMRVSMLNGCGYCLQHHLASSQRFGCTREDWQALKDPSESHFSATEKMVLAYAEKLTRTPWEITPDDTSALKKEFSDAQVADLHLVVGLANLTNRFTAPLGLELEFEPENI